MQKILAAIIMFFIWLPTQSAFADLDTPVPSDTIRVDATASMAKIVRLEYVGNHALVSTRHSESGVTTLPVDKKTAEEYHLGDWIPFIEDSTDVLIRDGYAGIMEMKKDLALVVAISENSEVSLHRDTEKKFISLAVKNTKTLGVALARIERKNENIFLITVRSGGLVKGPNSLDLMKKIVAETFNVVALKSDDDKLVHLAQSLVAEMRKAAKALQPRSNILNQTAREAMYHSSGAQSSHRP